jgi:hypothetical protein
MPWYDQKIGHIPVKFRSFFQIREKQVEVPGFCHKIPLKSGKFSLAACLRLWYRTTMIEQAPFSVERYENAFFGLSLYSRSRQYALRFDGALIFYQGDIV